MRVGFEWCRAGHCVHPECVTIQGGRLRPVEFPSLFAKIRHPQEGWILYDTGYSAHFAAATRALPEKLYAWTTPVTLEAGASAAERLRREGVAPEDVKWIVISHFHGDHVAGLRDFPGARFLASRAAFTALRARSRWANTRLGYLPALLPENFAERLVDWEERPRVTLPAAWAPFESARDLLGDGSLLAVPLEGHAHGQTGLVLTTENDRRVFLVADSVWHSESIRSLRLPHPIVRWLSDDARAYRGVIERLHRLQKAQPEALLMPSHCREFREGVY